MKTKPQIQILRLILEFCHMCYKTSKLNGKWSSSMKKNNNFSHGHIIYNIMQIIILRK